LHFPFAPLRETKKPHNLQGFFCCCAYEKNFFIYFVAKGFTGIMLIATPPPAANLTFNLLVFVTIVFSIT
jgi:hypothetical protein